MTIDPKEAAKYLRDLADRVERGDVDQVFTIAHKVSDDMNYTTESDVQGGTNTGAAYAIDAIANRIECCTDSSCLPGSLKLVIQGIMFEHEDSEAEAKTKTLN